MVKDYNYKDMIKSKHILAALLLSVGTVSAENVACVGNSITYGYGLPWGVSYPNNLQQLMGDSYKVSNFGVSSMTFAKEGNQSYWSQSAFTNAYNSEPDMVVIELGTNDSKFFFSNYPDLGLYNYNYGVVGVESLKADYRSLIDTFSNLKSSPEIWTTLQPYSNNISWTITDTAIVNVINPIIFDAAVERGVNIIDLHTLFRTPEWFLDDSVHPNESGAMELAKIIFDHLTMGKPALTYFGNQLSLDGGYGYYWYKDGELIKNAQAETLIVSEAGDYKALVKVKDSDNSYLVSNTITIKDEDLVPSSLKSVGNNKFAYANGKLYVPQKYRDAEIKLHVYDGLGRLIKETADIENLTLPSGELIIVVEVDGAIEETIKVIEN